MTEQELLARTRCFNCDELGHISKNCTKPQRPMTPSKRIGITSKSTKDFAGNLITDQDMKRSYEHGQGSADAPVQIIPDEPNTQEPRLVSAP